MSEPLKSALQRGHVQRFVVTGAKGYLGSHLCAYLKSLDAELVSCVRESESEGGGDERIVELSERDVLDSLLDEHTCLVHLASRTSVSASVRDPRGEVDANLLLGLNALESARKAGARFIFASSISVADERSPFPHREEVPVRPKSPYSACKASIELMAGSYGNCYGLDYRIARIGTLFGSDIRRFAIFEFVKKSVEDGRIDIKGNGEQLRDYIHVDDACEAIARIALLGDPQSIYNVATGYAISLKDLAKLILRLQGKDPSLVTTGNWESVGDVDKWEIDISRLRGLGFAPEWTLESGLTEMIRSVSEEMGLVSSVRSAQKD